MGVSADPLPDHASTSKEVAINAIEEDRPPSLKFPFPTVTDDPIHQRIVKKWRLSLRACACFLLVG